MHQRPQPRMYIRSTKSQPEPTDIYAHAVRLLDGGELDLETLRGHPTLFVNTASKCGLTPQYEGLQSLYTRYGDQGLRIVGSPSADFAGQEYDDAAEIGAFCQKNYGVTFPLTEKTSVRADPDPLWHDLATQPDSEPPGWNFAKYLVDGNGRLIGHWSPTTQPDDPKIIEAIEAALPG
jgi:glutathione peroxidase